jgi:hypothetical protein
VLPVMVGHERVIPRSANSSASASNRTGSSEPRPTSREHPACTTTANSSPPRRRTTQHPAVEPGCSSRALTTRPDPAPLAPPNQIPPRIRSSRTLSRAHRATGSAPPTRLPSAISACTAARSARSSRTVDAAATAHRVIAVSFVSSGRVCIRATSSGPTNSRWANRVSRE